MNGEFIWWHGLRIYVKDEGRGEPLLLINGLGANTDMWKPLAKHISHRRIICFDAPGTGRSSTPMAPVTIAGLADLAANVMSYRNVASADVLGYSYGGAVAQQFAYDHPARTRKLILVATTCGIGGIPGSLRALQVLATPFRYYSRTYFHRIAKMTYGGRTGRNLAVRQQMMATRRQAPPSSYGYSMQLFGGSLWSSWPFLHKIMSETLVLSGDDDPLIPVANAMLLARRIPRTKLEIVERAGHLFLWDDPSTVGERVCDFLGDKPICGNVARLPIAVG